MAAFKMAFMSLAVVGSDAQISGLSGGLTSAGQLLTSMQKSAGTANGMWGQLKSTLSGMSSALPTATCQADNCCANSQCVSGMPFGGCKASRGQTKCVGFALMNLPPQAGVCQCVMSSCGLNGVCIAPPGTVIPGFQFGQTTPAPIAGFMGQLQSGLNYMNTGLNSVNNPSANAGYGAPATQSPNVISQFAQLAQQGNSMLQQAQQAAGMFVPKQQYEIDQQAIEKENLLPALMFATCAFACTMFAAVRLGRRMLRRNTNPGSQPMLLPVDEENYDAAE